MRGEVSLGGCPAVAVASLYKPDLVTRHTGRAVRLSIERMLAEYRGHVLTVLDFRDVEVIDFSCADEVVAKLVLASLAERRETRDVFFLFRGLEEHHLDPIARVLERRRLAVAAERADGGKTLLGCVETEGERAWEAVCRSGRAGAGAVADVIGVAERRARDLLEGLYGQRLVLRLEAEYLSLFRALAGTAAGEGRA